jgi:predicted enzyme related to lactoylglutathione lyase
VSELNTVHNRAVWFDIPVANLERASKFYASVLAIKVDIIESEGFTFAVLEHGEGNGGCLVQNEAEISSTQGIMLYMNVNGRLQDAVSKVSSNGGRVVQAIHAIGPHGFRAVIIDSEGNRIVLHSETDV